MKENTYIITKISINKKSIDVYYCHNDQTNKLTLSYDVFSDFYLYEGKEIASDELHKIIQLNDLNNDLKKAYTYLSKKDYSIHGFEKKLQKSKISSNNISKIIEIVCQQGLLDDQRYAHEVKEELDYKMYGKDYIISFLRQEGIDEEIIANIVFTDENEKKKMALLFPILMRKWEKENYRNKRIHISHELQKRGFNKDDIQYILEHHIDINENDELQKCRVEKNKYYRIYQQKYSGYELNKRIIASLMRKGFSYDIIKQVMEDNDNEMD